MRIIYFDIDTLSPKHMGCYGYYRNTTPNIDEVAKESAIFTNMYTSDAPCLPSRTSLITGRYGINHGVVDHGGKYSEMRNTNEEREFQSQLTVDGLFGVIKRAGFRTASISSFVERHSAFQFNAGLNEIINYGDSAEQQADEIYYHSKNWIENNIDKDDWFLHIHMWDPHTPYRCPLDFGNPFEELEFISWIKEEQLRLHQEMVGPHTATTVETYTNCNHPNSDYIRAIGEVKTLDDVKTLIDGYDLGVLYADFYIGKLIQLLKDRNIYDDTMIVISSDHGENLGQLGMYSEHGTADEFTCNIPFIIKIPNKNFNGRHFDSLHLNIDILPTFAEYFNIQKQNKYTQWHGKSFLSTLIDGIDEGHDYVVLSQMSHVCQRSVRFGDYIYIRTYHDGYHLWEKEMLFNLKTDPNEEENIINKEPLIRNEAISYLMEWHDNQMKQLPSNHTEDPLWYIMKQGGPFHANKQIIEYVNVLKSLGKEKQAKQLMKNHPNWFND